MSLDNTFDVRETNARSLEFLRGMKALENTKKLCNILHIKTGAVVFYKIRDALTIAGTTDRYLCALLF